MDPALQELARPAAGPPEEQVSIIVRLRDADQAPPGMHVVSRFGDIVTARVARESIQAIWEDSSTVSVKAPHRYSAEVEPPDPLRDHAITETVRGCALPVSGDGVVVGLVDWGWDIAHPDLRRPDGQTRLIAMWDQRDRYGDHHAGPYGYGRIIDAAEINSALETENPYTTLDYDVADFDHGPGAHGSHTSSIVAGLADSARFVFVNMGREAVDQLPLGDSCELLEALHYIHSVAGDRPCVINLSLGRHAGEHTGHTLVELAMDRFLSENPGRAIVQSCGNYYERHTHESWTLRQGETRHVYVDVDPADTSLNEIDIWYPGSDRLTVEIATPDGELQASAGPNATAEIVDETGVVGRIHHRLHDPNNGDNQCSIFIDPAVKVPRWEIRLIGDDVTDGRVHAWIERDTGCYRCQSRFTADSADPTTTTGSIANGRLPIVVGAYDPHLAGRPLGHFSSSGHTRDGRQKPDCVAPGVLIDGARSGGGRTRMSGTSMAAPAVTATVALMFEAAGRPLHIGETRDALLGSCRTASDGIDPLRAGFGYLDIERAVAAVSAAPPSESEADDEMDETDTKVLTCPHFANDPDLADVLAGRLRLGAPGTSPYPAPVRSEGDAVRKVQRALVDAGYPLPSGVDGKFGPETGRAVVQFKKAHGITPDDPVVGPKTITALDRECGAPTPTEPGTFRVSASGRNSAAMAYQVPPRTPIPVRALSEDEPCPKELRIAVVGGGFAGLMAAWSLQDGGFNVTLFEARDQLGGRVRTDRKVIAGKIVEAGAELIGENHPTWIMLAKKFKLQLEKISTDDDYARQGLRTRIILGGHELTAAEKKQVDKELNRVLTVMGNEAKTVSAVAPWTAKSAAKWDNMSVADRFNEADMFGTTSSLARSYLEFTIENDNCAPVAKHSYLALLAAVSAGRMGNDMLGYWTHTETHRCAGGNDQIASHLAKGVKDIRLSSPVESITLGTGATRLTYRQASGQQHEAFDYVILAGPPITWPRVHSTPEFDATKFTVSHGPAVKFISTFTNKFWEKHKLAPVAKSDAVGSVWEATDKQKGTKGFGLTVYAGGGFVQNEATYTKRMDGLYPDYLKNRVDKLMVDWPNEPFIKSGYAVPAQGEVTTIVKNLNGSFRDRIYFAGEQASPGFFGYMEGALQSGLQAAGRVAVAIARRCAKATLRGPMPPIAASDAAELFDRISAGMPDDPRFRTIAAPNQPLSCPLHQGDLVIARGRGSPFTSVAVVAGPHLQARRSGVPGLFVPVMDRPDGHRVAGMDRVVPAHTVVVRALSEATPDSCPDLPVPPSQRPKFLKRPVIHRAVREIQHKLNAMHGYLVANGQPGLEDCPLVVDCNFGKHTEKAVKAFQRLVFPGQTDHHTGLVGEKTWAHLDAIAVAPDGVAQVTATGCRFDGPSGPLAWDDVIGHGVAAVDIECEASGIPIPIMPASVTVDVTALSPNGVTGPAVSTSTRITLHQVASTQAVTTVSYRAPAVSPAQLPITSGGNNSVTTIGRPGASSDAKFRAAVGGPLRGFATQPLTPGTRTSNESRQEPDAEALLKSAGVEVLKLAMTAVPRWKLPAPVFRQIRRPAIFVYYAGHGLMKSGKLVLNTLGGPCGSHGNYVDWVGPADLLPHWRNNDGPSVLIIAGCSVLVSKHAKAWAELLKCRKGSLTAILGYADAAPCDGSGGDKFADEMARQIASGSTNYVNDWLTINGRGHGWNAVGIDCKGYWSIDEGVFKGRMGWDIVGPGPIPGEAADEESITPAAALESLRFVGDRELEAVLAGTLRLGAKGTAPFPAPVQHEGRAIAAVQQALTDLGYPVGPRGVDGKFGPDTGAAVVKFKKDWHITPGDPVIGRATITALDRDISAHDRGLTPPPPPPPPPPPVDRYGRQPAAVSMIPAALATVATFRASTAAGPWAHLDRAGVATAIAERVNKPDGAEQGGNGLCTVAAFVNVWAQDAPAAYAAFATALFDRGEALLAPKQNWPRGMRVVASKALRDANYPEIVKRMRADQRPNQADWMVMSAIRDHTNLLFKFTGDPDDWLSKSQGDSSTHSELTDWLRSAGAWSGVVDESTVYTTSSLDHAKKLEPDRSRCILHIGTAMLLNKTGRHSAVLRSPVIETSSGMIEFRLWTWADTQDVSVSKEKFEKNYYGATKAFL
ncbi:FAD-dependent oxidoreductase [Mycobacterium sp. MMS18-G62]